jgi:hypothetical protein
MSMARCLR